MPERRLAARPPAERTPPRLRPPAALVRCRRLFPPALLLVILSLAACQTGPDRWITYPDEMLFAASADSLGLESFLSLPKPVREQARRRGGALAPAALASRSDRGLRAAHRRRPGPHRRRGLAAARPAPALVGDYQQTEDALGACRAALPLADPAPPFLTARSWRSARPGCATIAASGGAAWPAVDGRQAHGADAMRSSCCGPCIWPAAAATAGPGHRLALRRPRPPRPLDLRRLVLAPRRRAGGAHGIFTGTASDILRRGRLRQGPMRPTTWRAAECYRDFGTSRSCSATRGWPAATTSTRPAVPWRDRAVLSRVDRADPGPRARRPVMPVWLAYDRYYVTGSLRPTPPWPWTASSRRRAAEREFWAAAVLDAAGTCVRLDLHPPGRGAPGAWS
jgi:hypothetical protein